MEKIVSKALTENLRATKVARIPLDESAQWLLDISRDFYGVNQRLRIFLDELYHPFVNPGITLSQMRACFLGDLWWFTKQNENTENSILMILDMYR